MKSKIIDDLNWRYATKKFDPKKKVSKKDLHELLEALRLSPSSYGLQPWKFLVITDKKLRETLRNCARGQPQITDASHLIILCVRTDLGESYAKRYIDLIAKTRNASLESLDAYKSRIIDSLNNKPADKKEEWAIRQVFIALGMLLSACCQKRIDACPMEGFSREKFDEVLGLGKKNLKTVVLCPVGYRAKGDEFAVWKKVRFEKKDVFEFI